MGDILKGNYIFNEIRFIETYKRVIENLYLIFIISNVIRLLKEDKPELY